jgi:hypothetical protein
MLPFNSWTEYKIRKKSMAFFHLTYKRYETNFKKEVQKELKDNN